LLRSANLIGRNFHVGLQAKIKFVEKAKENEKDL